MRIKNEKGFTLIEILAVIVILGVLFAIGVFATQKYNTSAREKAFFTSVSNIIKSIKIENVLEEKSYCMYDYSKDSENQTKNIDTLYVLVHAEDGKAIYSVSASREKGKVDINVYDFNTLTLDNKDEWEQEPTSEESYTWYATSLTTLLEGNNNDDFMNYKVCETSK